VVLRTSAIKYKKRKKKKKLKRKYTKNEWSASMLQVIDLYLTSKGVFRIGESKTTILKI